VTDCLLHMLVEEGDNFLRISPEVVEYVHEMSGSADRASGIRNEDSMLAAALHVGRRILTDVWKNAAPYPASLHSLRNGRREVRGCQVSPHCSLSQTMWSVS
jgi:hypothetical protein